MVLRCKHMSWGQECMACAISSCLWWCCMWFQQSVPKGRSVHAAGEGDDCVGRQSALLQGSGREHARPLPSWSSW